MEFTSTSLEGVKAEASAKGLYVVDPNSKDGLLEEYDDVMEEADKLIAVVDPETTPYVSKYKARELLDAIGSYGLRSCTCNAHSLMHSYITPILYNLTLFSLFMYTAYLHFAPNIAKYVICAAMHLTRVMQRTNAKPPKLSP